MNWNTIYIKGNGDFRDEVRRRLEHSSVRFMPGAMEMSPLDHRHDLYWLDDTIELREFKKAVGSKVILKYRLRFFTSLADFLEAENPKPVSTDFTSDEVNMITSMKLRMKNQGIDKIRMAMGKKSNLAF